MIRITLDTKETIDVLEETESFISDYYPYYSEISDEKALDYIFKNNVFKQYNPFIFKYHQVELSEQSFIFEPSLAR